MEQHEISTPVAVLGAGTMGHGIAHVAALAGHPVRLTDPSPEALERGLERIQANLQKGVDRGKVTPEAMKAALERLTGAPDMHAAVDGAGVVIEAAPEKLDLKRSLFADISARVSKDALLATNTSSLSVSAIAEEAQGPERLVGMHFFNPVHIMPLLEIVRGRNTAARAVERAAALGRAWGKESITVEDVPGFATSRLGVAIGLEAIRMLEQGVASAEDIDKAMTLGYKHPVGPLKLTDMVGLDVRLAIAEYLHTALESDAFAPPRLLREKVSQGELGQKSGRGFYDWD